MMAQGHRLRPHDRSAEGLTSPNIPTLRLQENIQKEVVYSFFKVGVGLQIAPTIMAEDSMILKGAKKTTESEALQNKDGGPGTAKKKKMSKKERKRSKNK